MKILITGSTGFIGGSVGRYGIRAGHEVMGTGRSPESRQSGWPGQYVKTDPVADALSVVIRRFEPDLLLHAAGSASVGASLDDPLGDWKASALTCANLLEAVRRSGVRPLVIIPSSASVYGNPEKLPVSETAPIQPISPYGFHKAACESLAWEYSGFFGLDVVACRFFSVFGGAQRRLLIWELYQQLAGTEPVAWLDGSGGESRDFLHIDDVSKALLALADRRAARSEEGNCLVLNVARGVETSVREIAEQLRDLVAPQKEIRYRGNSRPGDPLRWQADISRLKTYLTEWEPGPLADDLARCTAEWKAEASSAQHGF